jgi:hypothetical protein
MDNIPCKQCKKEFTRTESAQKYCSDDCRVFSRRAYMKETLATRRETWSFQHDENKADVDDTINIAWFRTPGLHKFLRSIATDNRVIGIQINRNNTGIVISQPPSEEEEEDSDTGFEGLGLLFG